MRIARFIPVIVLLFFFFSCSTTKKSASGINEKNPSERGLSNMNGNDIKQQQLFVEGCHLKIIGETQQALSLFLQCYQQNPQNDVALYEIATIYYDNKDNNHAADYIAQAIKLNPGNQWYKTLSIDIFERLNKYSDAAQVSQQLCSQFPDNLDYQFDRAYFLSRASEYEKAIGAYNFIESKAGISENLSVEKQKLWDKLNKPEKGIEEIVRLKDAFPAEPRYVAMLADLYIAHNMKDKAFETIQQLARLDSTNSQAQFAIAEYYRKQGEWETSFPFAQRAFRDPAASIDNKVQLLLAYFPYLSSSEKRKQEAIVLGGVLIQVHPAEAKAFAVYGDLFNQVDMNKEALDAYKKAVTIDGSKFPVWQQVLYLESRLQQNDSLLKISQHVIELFPDQPLAYYYNGLGKEQSKQYNEAVSSFNRVLMMGADDRGIKSQIYASLGDCYHYMNDSKTSDSCYEQSISFDPSNVYALNNYSYYLATRGDKLDEAEKMSSKVVYTLAPNVASYLDTYAWVLYKLKRYGEAKTWIAKALSNNANSGEILDHYGDILFQLGDTENAVEYWKKARAAGEENEKIDKKINDRKLYE